MIVLISGAKKNVGDFLITDRAKKLLEKFVDPEVIVLNRFHDLSAYIELMNRSRAVVLGGGPAYTRSIYPDVYNFEKFYNQIKVPIIPMGLGWSGQNPENMQEFTFTPEALSFIRDIHARIAYSSCRDLLTQQLLGKFSIQNVLMTGCPVWYQLDKIGEKYQPKPIDKIVITTGASQRLVTQTLKLIKLVRSHFDKATIYLTYHRGILPGKETPPRKGLAYATIALLARKFNVIVRDVSGSLDKIDFYADCDLHVGYRVHAHLLFLANRKPSLLINEDGRGIGMGMSLKLPLYNMNDELLLKRIDEQLVSYKQENFEQFNATFTIIDDTFNVMKKFLESIK